MSELKASRTVVVTNPQGIHARPAGLFVKLAIKFQSKIEVNKDKERVDGKSILAMMTLAVAAGTRLTIEAEGPDAEQAVEELAQLVDQGFAEDEIMNRG